MGYTPIEDYGVIGNMRTCALVSMNGSIDWMCFPHFNSPTIFNAMLDDKIGGKFQICPICPAPKPTANGPATTDKISPTSHEFLAFSSESKTKQFYWTDTNVLVTRFLGVDGSADIIDFMPIPAEDCSETLVKDLRSPEERNLDPEIMKRYKIVRKVTVHTGALRFRVICKPAFNYAINACSTSVIKGRGAFFEDKGEIPERASKVRSSTSVAAASEVRSHTGMHHSAAEQKRRATSFPASPHNMKLCLVTKVPLRKVSRYENDYIVCDNVCRFKDQCEQHEMKQIPKEGNQHAAHQGDGQDGVIGEFTLTKGHTQWFVFTACSGVDDIPEPMTDEEGNELLDRTIKYWNNWISRCTYHGRWSEQVRRSALVLKLLTFKPTGAIVAAPTTSLPEHIGGPRNWDYRYVWIRDAAFTMYGLLRVGFRWEANDFMRWLIDRFAASDSDGHLELMYAVDGSTEMEEKELHHLSGYMNSRPVRIGNDALKQLQLDIYGELMDSAYLYNKYVMPTSYDAWVYLRRLVDYVCEHWMEPDEGIWEVRGPKQHFVYSKVMCWVAVDRGLRLAERRSFPATRDKWLKVRDAIYEDVMRNGWNEEVGAFTQAYGSDLLDASVLIMPLVLFISPTDPRMLMTIEKIQQNLVTNSLCQRYDPEKTNDGLGVPEGTFNMTSFWLIECMTRAGHFDEKKLNEARNLFEQMLSFGNHLGLFSEQTGSYGQALGNTPQAFTHLAFISAAYCLNRALGEQS